MKKNILNIFSNSHTQNLTIYTKNENLYILHVTNSTTVVPNCSLGNPLGHKVQNT